MGYLRKYCHLKAIGSRGVPNGQGIGRSAIGFYGLGAQWRRFKGDLGDMGSQHDFGAAPSNLGIEPLRYSIYCLFRLGAQSLSSCFEDLFG